jgi:hypothetical protein
MALLFVDGFDHYGTAEIAQKWGGVSVGTGSTMGIAPGAGRRGGGCLRHTFALGTTGALATVSRPVTADTAGFAIGVAVKMPSIYIGTGGVSLLTLQGGGINHLALVVRASGALEVWRLSGSGHVLLGTFTVLLPLDQFAYVELAGTIAVSPNGIVQGQVNGAPGLNVTGAGTIAGAALWTTVVLGQTNGTGVSWPSSNLNIAKTVDYDDFYACNGLGPFPWNTFLGDVRVDPRFPTANGANATWTPSSGTNHAALVDDPTPNGDVDYNESGLVGQMDTFVMQPAPAGSVILGIQHCFNMKKLDTGSCLVAPVVRHAGAQYLDTALGVSETYAFGTVAQTINPGTGQPWTEAGFNAAEFGYTRTA